MTHDHHAHSHTSNAEDSASEGECNSEPNFDYKGVPYLITELNPNCPEMTWFQAIDFCQSIGMQAITLDSGKTVEEKNNIINLIRERNLRSTWCSGFVYHPVHAKYVQLTIRKLAIFIDLQGRPTVTAGSDHYFLS